MHWFGNLTRTANVTSFAMEIFNAFGFEVFFQELHHGDAVGRQFQLQAQVTRRLDVEVTAGRVEAAALLSPGDAEVLGTDCCLLDAGQVRRRDEVRDVVEVLCVEGVCQQSESFAYALLLPWDEQRSPLRECGNGCRSETFWPSTLAEQREVVGKVATEAVLVAAGVAVVTQVAQESVRKRHRCGQTDAERVEEASVPHVEEASVVVAFVQEALCGQALQTRNGARRCDRCAWRVLRTWRGGAST